MHKSDDAARCIENEILMHLRKIKKHEQETSLNDQMGQDVEGGTLTLADILPSNDLPVDDQLAFKELTHHLYKWMHLLDEREAEIIQRLKQNEISIYSRVCSREDTDFFNKWSSIFSKYLSHKQF